MNNVLYAYGISAPMEFLIKTIMCNYHYCYGIGAGREGAHVSAGLCQLIFNMLLFYFKCSQKQHYVYRMIVVLCSEIVVLFK